MAGSWSCGWHRISETLVDPNDEDFDPPRHLDHLFLAGETITREVLFRISQLLTVEEELDLFRSLA